MHSKKEAVIGYSLYNEEILLMATYVTSDLHGQYKTFIKGLDTISFSSSDSLYVIGDAIDRGLNGIRILIDIMKQDNMDLIIGNHEFLMLNSVKSDGRAICNGKDSELWLEYNGGMPTFKQYSSMEWSARRNLIKWLKNRYVIKTLDVNGRKFCLSHSYYYQRYENKKVKDLSYNTVKDIVWPSVFYNESLIADPENERKIYMKYPYTFITGHVPVQLLVDNDYFKPYVEGNLIDIDGGCAFTGDETVNNGAIFLRLNDMKAYPIPLEVDNE